MLTMPHWKFRFTLSSLHDLTHKFHHRNYMKTFENFVPPIQYGAGRRTFHTWLAPILTTQKQVVALRPIRVDPWDPRGKRCHLKLIKSNETWLAVEIPTWGRLRKGITDALLPIASHATRHFGAKRKRKPFKRDRSTSCAFVACSAASQPKKLASIGFSTVRFKRSTCGKSKLHATIFFNTIKTKTSHEANCPWNMSPFVTLLYVSQCGPTFNAIV